MELTLDNVKAVKRLVELCNTREEMLQILDILTKLCKKMETTNVGSGNQDRSYPTDRN